MTQNALWRVSARATEEAQEAISELLEREFGEASFVYTNNESRATDISIFLSARPDWAVMRPRLASGLQQIRSFGLNTGAVKLQLRRIPPQDWAESWKRHFRRMNIGSRLLIKPSWDRTPPRKGQAVVVLDPGLSFGTGQHATTSFCLRQLVTWRRPGQSQSFLDVGTGSGILAIAAAKLGYSPVEAFDFDPDSVKVAQANAKLNNVERSIHVLRRDLATLPEHAAQKFSVICANLISNLLLQEKRKLVNRLRPGGVLVVAGILREEFAHLQKAYEALGLSLKASRAEREWRSGAFVRRS